MKLFLDDERVPAQPDGWHIVRTAEQFDEAIQMHAEVLSVISFDHDLGLQSESGKWCLRRLVDLMMDRPGRFTNLTQLIFHSANPTGSLDMLAYCENAADHVPDMTNMTLTVLSATSTTGYVTMPPGFSYERRTTSD